MCTLRSVVEKGNVCTLRSVVEKGNVCTLRSVVEKGNVCTLRSAEFLVKLMIYVPVTSFCAVVNPA